MDTLHCKFCGKIIKETYDLISTSDDVCTECAKAFFKTYPSKKWTISRIVSIIVAVLFNVATCYSLITLYTNFDGSKDIFIFGYIIIFLLFLFPLSHYSIKYKFLKCKNRNNIY